MATSATLPDTGTSVGSGSSGDAELGSFLSSAFDSAVAETGATSETPETPIETEPQLEASTPETVDAQSPTTEPEVPAGDSSYPLSEDGKSLLVPKGELGAIQEARKFQEAVGQWFQSPEEAQTAYLQASDLRAMSNDWLNGSDASVQGVLAHWAGMNHSANPAVQAKYQASFAKMAQAMPDMLAKIAPSAYQGMVQGMLTRAVEAAYEKASQTQNPEDFQRAQELDWGVTGQYKTELPKHDPAKVAETAAQARIREFEQRQEIALKRDLTSFNNQAVEGAKFSQLNGMIDKILEPVKARFGETAFGDLRAGIQRELVQALQGQPEWWLEHKQTWEQIMDDYRTIWQNGQNPSSLQPRVSAYINDFVSRAKRYLPSIAQKRIAGATAVAKTTPRAPNGQFSPTRQTAPTPPTTNGQKRLSSAEWDAQFGELFKQFR